MTVAMLIGATNLKVTRQKIRCSKLYLAKLILKYFNFLFVKQDESQKALVENCFAKIYSKIDFYKL